MKRHGLSLTLLLTAALVTPMTAHAMASDHDDLPSACRTALRGVHAYITMNRDTIRPSEAALLLQERAGSACGFDLFTGTATVDADAMAAFIAELNDAPRPSQTEASTWTPDNVADLLQETVPCTVPGSGPGVIKSYVLGVELADELAEGEWKAQHLDGDEVVQVSGSGGITSGVQAAKTGTIFLLGLPVPAIDGSTSASCVEIQTVASVKEECEWVYLVFYARWACEQTVEIASTLVPCEGAASQASILSLITTTHKYSVPTNC